MRVVWTVGSLREVSVEGRKRVVAETDVMFAGEELPPSWAINEDVSFVELPCGAVVFFERSDQEIFIQSAKA